MASNLAGFDNSSANPLAGVSTLDGVEPLNDVNTLDGVEHLKKEDYLVYLCSEYPDKRKSDFDVIKQSDCDYRCIKLPKPDENGLESYIASYLGYIFGKGCKDNILIISSSADCQATINFWKNCKYPGSFVAAPTIEKGLEKLNRGGAGVRVILFESLYRPVSAAD